MSIKINNIPYAEGFFLNQTNKDEFKKFHFQGEALFDFLHHWFNNSKTIEITTSGSTGKPKTFQVEKWKLEQSANRTLSFFNLKYNSTFLLSLPLRFIAGKLMVIRTLKNRGNLITQELSSTPLIGLKGKYDFAAFTPMQIEESFLKYPLLKWPNIKFLLIGGAAVNDTTLNYLSDFKGIAYETYGMTETLTHVALRQLTPNKFDYFTLLADIKMKIDQGLLTLMSNSFIKYKIKTNDIVEPYGKNNFKFIGRSDFVINSGGLKIQPEMIENQLKPSINFPFFISSLPHNSLGEMVVFVTTLNNKIDLNDSRFEILEKNMRPKSIINLNEFPLTESGKINRLALKREILNLI